MQIAISPLKTELNSAPDQQRPAPKADLGLDMPDDVQNALDNILQFYRRNHMRPHVNLSGDPLSITSGLVAKVQSTLPQNMHRDGKTLLNFMVHEIVGFCREHKVQSLSLDFVFESGVR